MSNHEYFRELASLSAVGQLSSEEDQELNLHLHQCDDCREAYMGYVRVVRHDLPLADAIRSRVGSSIRNTPPSADLRDRFLARARVEGLEFSPLAARTDVRKASLLFLQKGWRPLLGLVAASGLLILGTAFNRSYRVVPRSDAVQEVTAQLDRQNASLRARLTALREIADASVAELTRLKQRNAVSEVALKNLDQSLRQAREQSERLAAQLQQEKVTDGNLAAANAEKETQVADLSAKNEKLHRDRADGLADRIILETKIRELTESLQQQSASLERQRQLMIVSKDVRQIFGARNLHIIDVHDVDGAGKSAKTFGRVFYAENQSLIFYAFDLPSGRLAPAKYTFQAWGQKESAQNSVRNLGVFEIDDHEQHRWVLKVTDPQLLRDIDSVFVTAEPFGQAGGPHGRRLLYAYTSEIANHP